MKKRATPLQIYKLLDKSNCQDCGKETCLEFATEILDRKISLKSCTHLQFHDQLENYKQIQYLLSPPQKQIIFSSRTRKCVIGGEEVLYRHNHTFYNQTAIAVEINDNYINIDDIKETINYLTKLKISRIGQDLCLDALAVRYVSKDPDRYLSLIQLLSEISALPLILCCFDSELIKIVLNKINNSKPLLYCANKDNIDDFAEIALEYQVPLAIHGNTVENIFNMINSLEAYGVSNIVIDPGILFEIGGKIRSINKIQKMRYMIFNEGIQKLGYPMMGVPAALWSQNISFNTELIKDISPFIKAPNQLGDDPDKLWRKQYEEILMALLLEAIDTNLLVLHTGRNPSEIWGLLALLTFRQNIFTDPRVYPRVEPELCFINDPDEWSPIFVTSNYRMTKIPVEQDLIDAKLKGFLVVVDTEGIGIESATAGGQFNENRIKFFVEKFQVFQKTKHRILIIPGMAARLKEPIEEILNCEVWIGPKDSSKISSFIEEKWIMNKIINS